MFFKKKIKLAFTPRFHSTEIDNLVAIENKYFSFFSKYNAQIYLIPFDDSPKNFMDSLDFFGVVFAGGYRLYTEEIKKFEQRVLELCLKKNIPILAICCGMWTVNSFFGGNLKFIDDHQAFKEGKVHLDKMLHEVISNGTLVQSGKYIVNTFHDKVIDSLGSDLDVFLRTENGEIEGIVNREKKIIGVQFHMENKGVSNSLTNQIMQAYFDFK